MTWIKPKKDWIKPERQEAQEDPPPQPEEPSLEMMIQLSLPNKPFFRIKEVAAFFEVHPNTVRRWIDEGQITTVLVGNSPRVPRQALFHFCQKRR